MSKIEGEPDCCSDKSSGHEVLKKSRIKSGKIWNPQRNAYALCGEKNSGKVVVKNLKNILDKWIEWDKI